MLGTIRIAWHHRFGAPAERLVLRVADWPYTDAGVVERRASYSVEQI
jgi:hypothetical protein